MPTPCLQALCCYAAAIHSIPDETLALLSEPLQKEIECVKTYMEIGRLSLFKALDPKRPAPALALYLIRRAYQKPNQDTLNRAAGSGNAESGNADCVYALMQAPHNLLPSQKTLRAAAASGNPIMIKLIQDALQYMIASLNRKGAYLSPLSKV